MPVVKYKHEKKTDKKSETVMDNRKPNPNSPIYKKLKSAINRGKKG